MRRLFISAAFLLLVLCGVAHAAPDGGTAFNGCWQRKNPKESTVLMRISEEHRMVVMAEQAPDGSLLQRVTNFYESVQRDGNVISLRWASGRVNSMLYNPAEESLQLFSKDLDGTNREDIYTPCAGKADDAILALNDIFLLQGTYTYEGRPFLRIDVASAEAVLLDISDEDTFRGREFPMQLLSRQEGGRTLLTLSLKGAGTFNAVFSGGMEKFELNALRADKHYELRRTERVSSR